MIKVSVLYPKSESSSFDMDYYCNKHVPLLQRLLGDACTGVAGGGRAGRRSARGESERDLKVASAGLLSIWLTNKAATATACDACRPLRLPAAGSDV